MRRLWLLALLAIVVAVPAQAGTITTTFASNNRFAGNMFDVANVTGVPVTLVGTFRVHLTNTLTETLEVYTRPGTYVGHESSPVGWTLLGADTVTAQGVGTPTPIDVGNTLVIGVGQTVGMYVTLNPYNGSERTMEYTNGSNIYNDGVLQITTGIGKGDPIFTGPTFTPRTWNGEIDYELSAAAIPEPSTYALFGLGALGLLAWRRRKTA